MRQSGMPKQFLDVYGKPIIIYTLEAFQENALIDEIIIPCNASWMDYLRSLIDRYQITKVKHIVAGGKDRNDSIWAGLNTVAALLGEQDIIVIHDGVRPLIQQETIDKNIEIAKKHGNAMTVRANIETVVVTEEMSAKWDDFKNRNITYTLTAPQSFQAAELLSVLKEIEALKDDSEIPLLDVSLMYARLGKRVYMVIEEGNNLKITTPEDYYYLKSYFELRESKHILGV
mgnify:CR=1 FL=1